MSKPIIYLSPLLVDSHRRRYAELNQIGFDEDLAEATTRTADGRYAINHPRSEAFRRLLGQPQVLPKRPWEFPGYGAAAGETAATKVIAAPPEPDEDYGAASQPGAMMHFIFERIGYKAAPNCGCAAFARQMNQWGWVACLTTRKQEIIQFFITQARTQGIEVNGDRVWDLFVGGGKDRLAAIKSKVTGGVLKLLGMTPKPDKV